MLRAFWAACLVVGLVGCGILAPPPRMCTQIGCESAAIFELDADLVAEVPYDVEACVDDRCARATLRVPPPADGPFTGVAEGRLSLQTDTDSVTLTLGEGAFIGLHRARLSVRDEAGNLVARVDVETGFGRNQPNGPGCEPICWIARIDA